MPHVLTADVVLLPPAVDFSDPANCAGTGAWSDIHSGAEVSVSDAAGGVVGRARLSRGEALGTPKHCRFTIRVGSLPRMPAYTVKIGAREGGYQVDFADLDGFMTILMP